VTLLCGISLDFNDFVSNHQGGRKYVRNKYVNWLQRPNHWPRRTSTGADTGGNGNAPPGPASRDRQALVETLGFRHIGVVHDEYAVSPDGMKGFGVLDLATEIEGCRFSIGLRNSHDKSLRLAMTCGYRVFVCSNMAFAGDFVDLMAKNQCLDDRPVVVVIVYCPSSG
jgi:hypothetical protein